MEGSIHKNPPLDDSHVVIGLCRVFSLMYISVPGPPADDWATQRRTGATPLFEVPVRAWYGAGFHKHRPALPGSPPSLNQSLREGNWIDNNT